ncbi:hypothetical protein [Kocuria sp. cx-455]|uniref:hypothetical protein n=1 Tax=Kocuria sp. cx-455 TaxID=2771377 RepID=UPI003D7050D8
MSQLRRIAGAMHQMARNAVDNTEPQDPIRVGSTLTDQGNPEHVGHQSRYSP